MNNNEILKKVKKLYKLFQDGEIPTLAEHEVNPNFPKSSRENYLYFTLPSCLNFQRSSTSMWQSALKTYNDTETRYLFFPEEVVKRSREVIQIDLEKHKLSLQRNKHTDIWITISKTFNVFYNNDPRVFLKSADWDIVRIHKVIQQDMKKSFPYLSGPKMSNYWLYILSYYTDAKLINMQEISIIPDTHVLQSTIKLGISEKQLDSMVVANLWKDLLDGSGIHPVQMHPVLWNWSRNNFKPEV